VSLQELDREGSAEGVGVNFDTGPLAQFLDRSPNEPVVAITIPPLTPSHRDHVAICVCGDHAEPNRFAQKLREFLRDGLSNHLAALLTEADRAPFDVHVAPAEIRRGPTARPQISERGEAEKFCPGFAGVEQAADIGAGNRGHVQILRVRATRRLDPLHRLRSMSPTS
jgi:hypothetical protein